MEFYYIGHDISYANRNIPKKPFEAVMIKDKKTHEITLYPVLDRMYGEFFISHKGWIKKCKTKMIPLFSLKEKDWEKYRKKYGDYCLFYSLTGNDLVSQDCSITAQQNEYNSLCVEPSRITDYKKFIRLYNKVNEIQRRFFKFSGYKYIDYYDYLFTPLYTEPLAKSYMPITYDVDVYGDDKKLEKAYNYLKDTKFPDTALPEDMASRIELIYGKECLDYYNKLLNVIIIYKEKKKIA